MIERPNLTEEEQVLAVEDEYVRAEISREEAVLQAIIDDRFVFNQNSGSTSGKAELIESILEWEMTGQRISERSVLVAGDTAVVCGTAELRFAGEDQVETKSVLRYTTAYIKRQKGWRMLALHMSRREPVS